MELIDYKPRWQVLIPTIIVMAIVSIIVSVKLLDRFINKTTVNGDVITYSPSILSMLIVVVVTLVLCYIISILIQKIIHLKYVKLALGILIFIFALYLYPYAINSGGMIFPILSVICLFIIFIILIGQALKKSD